MRRQGIFPSLRKRPERPHESWPIAFARKYLRKRSTCYHNQRDSETEPKRRQNGFYKFPILTASCSASVGNRTRFIKRFKFLFLYFYLTLFDLSIISVESLYRLSISLSLSHSHALSKQSLCHLHLSLIVYLSLI